MGKYLYLSFCLLFACLSPLHAQQPVANSDTSANQPEVGSQIIALEHRYWEAWKHKDAKTLTQLRADDFREADHDGVWDKKQTEQGDLDLETPAFTMNNERVSVLQPNVALLTYEIAYTSSYKGKDISSSHSYIASLYARRKSYWQLVYTQESLANDSQGVKQKEAQEEVVQAENALLNTYVNGEPDDAAVLKEILASEYRIVDALARDDIEGFAKLLPEDVMDIDDDGVHTKAEWIPEFQEMKARGYLFRNFRFDDPKLIRLGPDQATFTAKEIIHGLDKGKRFELRYYTNATYVRQNGKWGPRVYQDTPMVK